MSEALSRALVAVGRDLERGILDAERELADSRERCRALETEVRALEAAVRPLPPALEALLSITESRSHDPAPSLMDEQGSIDGTELYGDMVFAPPGSSADPLTTVAPATAAPYPNGDETSTDYMPMLEELWGIARRDASS